ncbi:MAG TPA: amidohydrolase [Chloroflexota bacterium]|nr:amidohydrolase [Chloroflexota bacterium]
MELTKEELKARVCTEIDRRASDIVAVSEHIMRHPEAGFREQRTSTFVREQLDRMGLPHRDGLALTGVKARMRGRAPGPTVGVLGELDSLIISDHPLADRETHAAHACGHNAQIASMLGAGMGLQTVMDQLDGDVVLFAVPAEEYIEVEWRLQLRAEKKIELLTGKSELIKLGEFDDIDMATITHTTSRPEEKQASVGMTYNGCAVKFMRFLGKSAHAGGAPHNGINALKAAMLALQAIDAQRETFRDEDHIRVHPIVTRGGDAVSAIPADVRLETFVRGKSLQAIQDADAKVDRCLRAGAMAMGATVEITTLPGYLPLQCDPNLAELSLANCRSIVGAENIGASGHATGSTDLGDLGMIMPVVHPRAGGAKGNGHGNDYWTVDQHVAAVNPAKAMALTAIDLLYDGAKEARRVKAEAGPKLSREAYLELVRGLAREERYR